MTTIRKVRNHTISILPEQLKRLKRNGLDLSPLKRFSLIRPLLVIGVLIFAVWLSSCPSSKMETNCSIPDQSLFVKSQRTNVIPPPLRIVEASVLESNKAPSLITPQTLGAMAFEEERDEIIKYEVESGDTVTSIAEEFNLESETVLWANDLGWNSTLQPGDELLILPVDGVLYSVRQGDTISNIAQAYDAKAKQIIDYNDLASETDIYAGDHLILPGGERPTIVAAAKEVPLGDNSFSYPCEGIITQSIRGVTHRPSMHAVDVANDCGSRVIAVADGEVKRAGYAGLLGKRITIMHRNGVATLYGHLSQVNVVPGQEVHKAEIIGRIGNTGFTIGRSGCHLHYATPGAYNPLRNYAVGSTISW